jgi:hypothetical protein
MTVNYGVTGADRKALVLAISQLLDKPVFYMGTPTFKYIVGGCVVDRDGTLTCPIKDTHATVSRTASWLIDSLKERGFTPIADSGNRLVIEMPMDGFSEQAMDNLKKIISSKEALFKKALGADSLPVKVDGDKLCFPWFTLTDADGESNAYMHFVTSICKMAKTSKRITSKEKPLENDKFTMRLFLVRLGFVGNEYKQARKILLRNLLGNSSWKNGQPQRRKEVGET